jgi:cellulose synthase/poly-beta-1,6-N-acetylglucosamine synthase-like glycosyltransferase/anti-anti-sigma regulatory factor
MKLLIITGLSIAIAAYTLDLIFLAIGFFSIRKQSREQREKLYNESDFPPLTILVPCFNEEKAIKTTVKYLEQIDYPDLKFIIINDGSTDSTFDILKKELRLTYYPMEYHPFISTDTVKGIYHSGCGKFIVVDKSNGGKADSLNAGLNLCKTELVCCVDADTIIKRDALKKLVIPFLQDSRVVATGGNVRLKNGSTELREFPNRLQVPRKILVTLQVMEYIRSINISRNALAAFNANLIISGAFGVFKTGILKKIGGYEKYSKGEDFELVSRIHLYMRQRGVPYRIPQVYTADSFTDGPEGIKALKSQRKRWQIGLVSTLRAHFFKFYRHPFSVITLFSLPYYILFEIFLPIVQLLTYPLIPVLILWGIISWKYLLYLLFIFVYSSLINILYLAADLGFNTYYESHDQLKIIFTSLIEPFFYHQLNCYWKLLGLTDHLRKTFFKSSWSPPRGEDNLKSQWLPMSIDLNLDKKGGLGLSVDYKSLNPARIIVMALEGSFEMNDINRFDKVILNFKRKNRKRFILEMESLKGISSEALSYLVQLTHSLKKEKGNAVIFNPNSKIEAELKISNAVKEIKIFKNYSDAIKELKYK